MGDEINRMYIWICPNCGQRYEEPNIGQLEVRTQRHKCKITTNKDPYLAMLLKGKGDKV